MAGFEPILKLLRHGIGEGPWYRLGYRDLGKEHGLALSHLDRTCKSFKNRFLARQFVAHAVHLMYETYK
jgi:hypothetical protein